MAVEEFVGYSSHSFMMMRGYCQQMSLSISLCGMCRSGGKRASVKTQFFTHKLYRNLVREGIL